MLGWERTAALFASRPEALDELLVLCVAVVQRFDGNAPPELLVIREVDGRHTARAELSHHEVPAVEDLVEPDVGSSHGYKVRESSSCSERLSGSRARSGQPSSRRCRLVLESDRDGDLRALRRGERDEPRRVAARDARLCGARLPRHLDTRDLGGRARSGRDDGRPSSSVSTWAVDGFITRPTSFGSCRSTTFPPGPRMSWTR